MLLFVIAAAFTTDAANILTGTGVVVRNRDTQPHAYRVTVEFHDKDGFIVDTDDADGVVQANSEATITDYDLVTATVAGSVAGTKAKVQQVR